MGNEANVKDNERLGKALLDFAHALQAPDPGGLIIKRHEAVLLAEAIWNNGEDQEKLEARWPWVRAAAEKATSRHYAVIEELSRPFFRCLVHAFLDTPIHREGRES